MQRREADFQSRLNKWAKHFWNFGSALVECKTARGTSLAFDAVTEKQVRNLLQASEGFFYHTFSDYDRMGTPADCVYLDKVEGFVAIQYYKPRGKLFYLVPIAEWVNEKETSSRKSLTEDRAKEIGIKCSF